MDRHQWPEEAGENFDSKLCETRALNSVYVRVCLRSDYLPYLIQRPCVIYAAACEK